MRLSTLAVLVSALTLSACATSGAGPNGWAAGRRSADRPARAPERVAERPPVRLPAPSAREHTPVDVASDRRPATASGLVIPVVGIGGDDLRDSFHAPRSGGRTHNAIDIAAPRGTPLVAVTDGTIRRKHWNGLGGNTLYLRSADGSTDFYYAHLDAYADGIEVGARVRRGETLGTVGSTGNAQGPHLHFQVLDVRGDGRGTPVNPFGLLRTAELALAD
ncbi:M23 family metallopeptidase [Rubrivirga sp. IMCC43871]|uniref:M23 family metallopeptidase n=1 Tax=Rubrivirga sp. IMCC43871 TaxID=3391575 RepID=UPI0039903213